MPINLKFDTGGNIENPTMVLALKSGKKLRALNDVQDLVFSDSIGNPSEFTFSVSKNVCPAWQYIRNFRLIWVSEWDEWYEIQVDTDDDNKITKKIIATHLPECELSQINLHGVEINTEADIGREDYDEEKPTIFFDDINTESSLLHRITKEAVNFTFGHIDESLKHIQRIFSFDKISIYDAFQKIAEEVHCYFKFESYTDSNGKIGRRINAYDLEYSCSSCGRRWEFEERKCPKCSNTNIKAGYGKDTTVFLSIDNALDGVNYTTDVDSVKNCFYLEADDDLMTAAIIACNPNGSQYIWYISQENKEDMSDGLVEKLDSYDDEYKYYCSDYIPNLSVDAYNSLIAKYKNPPTNNNDLVPISSLKGYPSIMNAYFDTIDMELYLSSKLMPSSEMSDTSSVEQASNLIALITNVAISGAVNSITANNAVLSMAKAIIDSRYKVEIADGAIVSNNTWVGRFIVTNYSDNEDAYMSENTTITITDDYESFILDKITKVLAKGDNNNYGITGLFNKDLPNFKNELLKYGLNPLESLLDCCQGALDILIDQGIANKDAYDEYIDPTGHEHLYDKIYLPYLNKLHAIQDELSVREQEISVVTTLQDDIEKIRIDIQKTLDFEKYLGIDFWKEFSAFRREDTYQNSNYSSDGLDNAELFRLANEFISVANTEIKKSGTLQHSITTSMKNILIMPEFAPMCKNFEIGNWIRIEVDDQVYKLRLLSYELVFNNYENLNVTFSDVMNVGNDISDIQSVLNSAQSMSTSYDAVIRQASKGSISYNLLDNWSNKGLDATSIKIMNSTDSQDIIYDSHGILCRRKNDFTGAYDLQQLKIINSTIAMTNDGWNTVKTAIGKVYIYNPEKKEYEEVWGINGELLCGKLIIGEELGIYNSNATLKFDKNGLKITNDENTVLINPNSSSLFVIKNHDNEVFKTDTDGNLKVTGNITATTLTADIAGTIAGWNITSGGITYSSSNYEVHVLTGTNTNKDFLVVYDKISKKWPFYVHADGTLHSEKIDAVGGQIGGFKIGTSYLANNTSSIAASNNSVYVGIDGISCGRNFKVNNVGILDITDTGELEYDMAMVRLHENGYPNNCSILSSYGIKFLTESNDYASLSSNQLFFQSGTNTSQYSMIGAEGISTKGTIIAASEIIGQCISGDCQFRATNNNYGFMIRNDDSNTYFLVTSEGNPLGKWNDWRPFYIKNSTGQIYSQYALSITSDERDKDILGEPDSRYENLFMNLSPILFRWKDKHDTRIQLGLGARATEKLITESGLSSDEFGAINHEFLDTPLSDGRKEKYSINYQEIYALMIPVLQKAIKLLSNQEKEISSLKKQVSLLEKK